MSADAPVRKEYLSSDQEYIVYQFRILLDVLEEVKLGFAPRADLDAALENFVKFKLPTKYSAKLTPLPELQGKYRMPYEGEIVRVQQAYQSDDERKIRLGQIENEIRFNALLDSIEQIKKLLEDEGLMNVFASDQGESVGGPV